MAPAAQVTLIVVIFLIVLLWGRIERSPRAKRT